MVLNTHLHFLIWAAMEHIPPNYSEVTYVDLVAEKETEAVSRTKKLALGRSATDWLPVGV